MNIIAERKYDLIFVGNRKSNSDYNKGFDMFLEICQNIDFALKVICVGNVTIPKEIGKIHRFSVYERVSRKKLIDFFSDTKLQVLCSSSEGMPNVILEAMVVGTPTISMKVGGISNIIIDGINGTLIKKAKPDLFIKAIKNTLSNKKLWTELSDNCTLHSKRYSKDKIGPKFEALLKR